MARTPLRERLRFGVRDRGATGTVLAYTEVRAPDVSDPAMARHMAFKVSAIYPWLLDEEGWTVEWWGVTRDGYARSDDGRMACRGPRAPGWLPLPLVLVLAWLTHFVLVLRRRPAVISAPYPWIAPAAALARMLRRGPALVTRVQGRTANKHASHHRSPLRARITDALEAFALRRADVVLTIGPSTRQYAEDMGADPERIVVMPAPTAWRGSAPALNGRDSTRVICASRLVPEKGVDVLLRAWAIVAATRPDARLEIAGDGVERARLEALARELGVARSVVFHGVIAPADMSAFYPGALVNVLPSLIDEGLGLALIEGGLAGCALVGSDVNGIRDVIVPGENGELVPRGDHEALAETLLGLLARPDHAQALGMKARRGALAYIAPFERRNAEVRERLVTLAGGEAAADASGVELQEEFWQQRSWWRRAGATAVGVWAATGLAFVATVIAARGLGPEDYGAVVVAIAAANFIATLADLTLEDGVVYHGFQALERGDQGGVRSLIRAALVFDVVLGVIVAAGIVALAGPIAGIVSGDGIDATLIAIAALVPLAGTVDGASGAALLVAGRADLRGWVMAVGNVVRVVAVAVVVVTGGGPIAVICAYAVAALAASVLQLAVVWRVGWRQWRRHPYTRPARSWIRPLTRFGIHSSVMTSLLTVESSLVPLLLGALVGTTAAGIFNVALLPFIFFAVASAPIRMLFFPEQARLAASGALASLRRAIWGYTLIATAIALPCAALMWIEMPALIELFFGSSFGAAVEPARLLLLSAVISVTVGAWVKTLPVALGKPQLRSAVAAVFAVISVGLTVALAGPLEATGAAIAHLTGTVVVCGAWLVLAPRMLRDAETVPAADPPPEAPQPVTVAAARS